MKKRNYRITTKSGQQLKLKKVNDEHLNKIGFSATIKLRKTIYHLLEVHREINRRGLEHPAHMANGNAFDILTGTLALALNDLNHKYNREDNGGEEE